MHDVHEILRSHGLRATDQRVAVLQQLWIAADGGGGGHLTAAQLVDRLGSCGQPVDVATVYRTLATLAELGVVHAVNHAGNAPRQASYGLAMRDHYHAVCTQCGSMEEIPAHGPIGAFESTLRRTGFSPHHDAVTIHGLCANCLHVQVATTR